MLSGSHLTDAEREQGHLVTHSGEGTEAGVASPAFNSGWWQLGPRPHRPPAHAGPERQQPGLARVLCGHGQVDLDFPEPWFSLCKIKGLEDWTREPFL